MVRRPSPKKLDMRRRKRGRKSTKINKSRVLKKRRKLPLSLSEKNKKSRRTRRRIRRKRRKKRRKKRLPRKK